MNSLFTFSSDVIGIAVWVLWALIGVFGALIFARATAGRRILWFDIIIGAVASTSGGYLSTCFIGDSSQQAFLLSILGAVFAGAIVLWISGALFVHFRRDEDLDK